MGTTRGTEKPTGLPKLALSEQNLNALLKKEVVQLTLSGDEWPGNLDGRTVVLTNPASRVSRAVTVRVSESDVYALLCGDAVECTANNTTFELVGPSDEVRAATPQARVVDDVEMVPPDGISCFSFEIR